ncbi:MAG: hypothetical protein ABI725_02970 [Chloroflexota bacterium]
MRHALLAVGLTFVLGGSVAAAFYAVGGQSALLGPYVLNHSWPVMYTLVAVFAAVVTAPIAYFAWLVPGRVLVAVILAAWAGEYVVLASGVLANELNPLNAIGYWIAATGGPLQPVGAFVGAWLAWRLRAQPSRLGE